MFGSRTVGISPAARVHCGEVLGEDDWARTSPGAVYCVVAVSMRRR